MECGKGHSEDLSALYPTATQNSILWCTCEILKKPHKSLEATGCGKWSTAMQLMITQTMGTHTGEERRHSFSRWVVNESGKFMFRRALKEGLLKEGHGLSQPWPATSKWLSVFFTATDITLLESLKHPSVSDLNCKLLPEDTRAQMKEHWRLLKALVKDLCCNLINSSASNTRLQPTLIL